MWCIAHGNISPKSFHRNIEGARSGFVLRSLIRFSSSWDSCGVITLTLPPPPICIHPLLAGEEPVSKPPTVSFSWVSSVPTHFGWAFKLGLRACRFTHRISRYSEGMPTGYTFSRNQVWFGVSKVQHQWKGEVRYGYEEIQQPPNHVLVNVAAGVNTSRPVSDAGVCRRRSADARSVKAAYVAIEASIPTPNGRSSQTKMKRRETTRVQ